MKINRSYPLIFFGALIAILLVKCAPDQNSSGSSSQKQGWGALQFSVTAFEKQDIRPVYALQSREGDQVMKGQIQVKNLETQQTITQSWIISLNETTLEATSDKTINLDLGNYEFSLLLINGNQQYAGVTVFHVVEGVNTIPMTIHPILGETLTSVSILSHLADFKLQYDPEEITTAGLVNPQMGIVIDGGGERIFAINPTTGFSSSYINLPQ